MSVERAVQAIAGFIVFLSVALGYYVNEYWFLLTAFAGFNLFQSAFTGFCPLAIILKMLGLKSSSASA